ncbi:Tetratricopeptide repeat (TPR)-like superfamily protein [Euphorbia peplus]|nr:Tetratricopeptide repeat (TPR)-like superfamily protein [Euphorbia peplus]
MDHKEGLLAFLPEMEAQPPLCVSQYALVNYACAFTHTHPTLEDANYDHVYLDQGDGHEEGNGHGQNYTQVTIEPHRSDDEHRHRNGSSRRHGHEGGGHGHEGGRNHRPVHGGRHNHRHEHEGGRNQRPRDEGGHNHRHEYQHRSRHGRGHNHRNEHGRHNNHRHEHENEHGSSHRNRHRRHVGHHRASEDECCKWLTELDDICVCNLLVRLPPFLSRLQHKYSIRVGNTCKVSYQCEGRNIIF